MNEWLVVCMVSLWCVQLKVDNSDQYPVEAKCRRLQYRRRPRCNPLFFIVLTVMSPVCTMLKLFSKCQRFQKMTELACRLFFFVVKVSAVIVFLLPHFNFMQAHVRAPFEKINRRLKYFCRFRYLIVCWLIMSESFGAVKPSTLWLADCHRFLHYVQPIFTSAFPHIYYS